MKRLLTSAIVFAAAGGTLAAGPAANYDFEQCAHERQCRIASDAELDQMRGGFTVDTSLGTLDIAIAITRQVAVNGQLVAVSQLVVPNASSLVAAAMAQADAATASVMSAAQAGAPGQPANGANVSAPVVVNGVPVATGSSAPILVAPGQPLAVQIGDKNVASLGRASVANVLPTIIQNSANNQLIQSLTQILVTVNSLSVLRGLALGDLVNRATLGFTR